MITLESLPKYQQALADAGLDGWLLFDFHGVNPIAGGLLGLEGMGTRRVFAWLPRTGTPVAVMHAIEQGPWRRWPTEWRREIYSSWRSLESTLGTLIAGKRVAMEYSPGDAVPYVDRIPAGVIEMVRSLGAEVVSSAELVTRFYAVWTDEQLASHLRAAEIVSEVGRSAIAYAGVQLASGVAVTEHEIQARILQQFERAGLEADHGPIVAAGANAADPHYEPSANRPRTLVAGELLLVDLWGRERNGPGVYADQTWMGSLGNPSDRAMIVWTAVRDARNAAISLLRDRVAAGEPVRGAEADDAARDVIASRGFGEYFTHRTGHSIDARSLHGSGPHLDNLETREERQLVRGVGFSVEPGIYVPGDIGVRSEVNAYIGEGKLVVTPAEYQRDLIVV